MFILSVAQQLQHQSKGLELKTIGKYRFRFDARLTRIRHVFDCQSSSPVSRSHANLFIYLGRSAAALPHMNGRYVGRRIVVEQLNRRRIEVES